MANNDVENEIRKLMRPKSVASSMGLPSKNLLDCKMEQKFKDDQEDKKTLINRMVIISKIGDNCDSDDIGTYYEKLFKDIQQQHSSEAITGLLLLYPKHCAHIIEGSTEVLLATVKDLQKHTEYAVELEEKNVRCDTCICHTTKSQILVVSHDIPSRLFQQWSYRVMDIEAPNVDLYEPTESVEKLVIDLLTQCLKLGAYLNKQSKASLKSVMDNLHDKVPDLLPQQVVIGWLLECENEDALIDTKEYVDSYEKPYDIVMAGDFVWPMAVRLFPYN